ncbi:unnamed protein product [Rotaria socialis]|uniref:Uncharacterized protein n=2 Tax=Rotaria socialis TaxID=392032 RepID=A0A820R3L1_9BILA|nr:unnamed protein product [Rotaria socialis]CAF3515521.1 unnamed protein product [Rotaria socialis]CAF3569135.1 unnamed protein product [Rotaria socialis]CAF3618033.1 unnamed protein product [Rotaria socialis]CAF4164267.1 unnamed protein product [Rotaria socialis]
MLSGILKLTLFINILFLFVAIIRQAAATDIAPTSAIHDNLATFKGDVFYFSVNNKHTGAGRIKRSMSSTVDQPPLIDSSRFHSSSRVRHLRKNMRSKDLKNSPSLFRSTGISPKRLRMHQRIRPGIDYRLKRFRMLDPDEFKEMLNTMGQQMPHEQSKGFNNLDTIGGMQVENYWTRK